MAHWIGCARVAGECEGLAAAAAEILLALGARAAGFLHPVGATKRHERGRIVPDILQCVFANVPEIEVRNAFRRMARQHLAGGRDIERAPSPSTDTRFR